LSVRIEANGRRFWFDVDGPALVPDGPTMRERPTVLLLHGGPGSFDHSYFKPDFARLAEAAQIVYLDLPGHGRSDPEREARSPAGCRPPSRARTCPTATGRCCSTSSGRPATAHPSCNDHDHQGA
jgi:pimeloyl-ACP methyl ester carboxylesterase